MHLQTDDLSFIRGEFKKCGLRMTPNRVTIFSLIRPLKTHPTVDDVYRLVKPVVPSVTYDTVNRTMQTFHDCGLIRKTETYGSTRRFDTQTHSHNHFHCHECGNIYDFELKKDVNDIENLTDLPENFTITGVRIVYAGICSSCQEKNRNHHSENR